MDIFTFQLGLWGNALAALVLTTFAGCMVVMFTQRTSPAATTATSTKKKGGLLFHRIGVVASLISALFGADVMFNLNITHNLSQTISLSREIAEEVIRRQQSKNEMAHAEAEAATAAPEENDSSCEPAVVSPTVVRPKKAAPKKAARRLKPSRSPKQVMCDRWRLVRDTVDTIKSRSSSQSILLAGGTEDARKKVNAIVNHANGRATRVSRMEEICGNIN